MEEGTLDREELNKKAYHLWERADGLGLSLGHVSRLEKECKEIKQSIQRLKQEILQLPPPPDADNGSCLSVLLRERHLLAEIAVWKQLRGNHGRSEVMWKHLGSEVTQRKLEIGGDELKKSLEAVKQERRATRTELDSEKKYLEETNLILESLQGKVVCARVEEEETQPQNKLEESQKLAETLREQLVSFVEEQLCELTDEGQKNKGHPHQTSLISSSRKSTLLVFIRKLIDKSLTSCHDPYLPVGGVSMDDFLFLLRSGVVQRHPNQPSLVRLTPFHH